MVRKIIGTIAAIFLFAILPIIAVADTTIVAGISDSAKVAPHNGAVWINRSVAYVFSATATNALKYVKTTNGGVTWASAVQIDDPTPPGGYRINGFDVWFDQWTTPGSAPYIHIAWRYFTTGSPQAHLSYNRLNTTNDSLLLNCDPNTTCDINTGNSDNVSQTCTWQTQCVSITKDSSLNVYIKDRMTTNFFRSVDDGVSWASRTGTTDSPPWILAPGPTTNSVIAVGSDATNTKIQEYDNVANTWTVIQTIAHGFGDPYAFKGWAATLGANETWVGVKTSTAFRIYRLTWSGSVVVVTERTAVSGYAANSNDIDLSYDLTNGDLYAFYNDGSIRYQVSKDNASTWETEQTVSTTNVVAVRVAPVFPATANRLMPIFFNNPNWVRNINTIILTDAVAEPEDIDNWFIHFIEIWNFNDANGRTVAASGVLLVIAIALFLMRIHYLIVAVISVIFATGLSQVRIPDGSRLLEPWIILVILIIAGLAILLKILAPSGSGAEDDD